MIDQTYLSTDGILVSIEEVKNGVKISLSSKGSSLEKIISREDFISSFITLFFVFGRMQRNWFVKYLMDNVNPKVGLVTVEEFRGMCKKALGDTIKQIGGVKSVDCKISNDNESH